MIENEIAKSVVDAAYHIERRLRPSLLRIACSFSLRLCVRPFLLRFIRIRVTMCFFIAGIQPKTVTLKEHPRMCQACGLYQARLKRVDHYLSLFFLPIFRVKKGEPFLQCQSCGSLSGESGDVRDHRFKGTGRTCPYCSQPLKPEFRFCPSCGKKL